MKTLIVDDIGTIQRMIGYMLKKYGDSDFAVNGNEAIEKFQYALNSGDPYKLICMDILMPEKDGLQTVRHIRQIEKVKNVSESDKVKIIIISALNQQKYVLSAIEAGSDSYLLKPLYKDKLIMELEKLNLINSAN